MKKLAIGCGILLVVLLVGGAVAAYVIYSKVKSTVAEFAALGEIPAIERGVRNTATFTPPDSGELTEAQVARYVKVQQDVRALLGPRFDEFQTKYAELSKRMEKNQGTALDAPSVIAAYRDLARTYVDAKKAQVESLNRAGFSLGEYRWVRQQAYAAIGMPVMDVDVVQVHRGRDLRQGARAATYAEPGRLDGAHRSRGQQGAGGAAQEATRGQRGAELFRAVTIGARYC